MILAAEWSPSDHFGMWQLVVGAAGFALAVWQLARAANATERSADLLARRLLHNDLLVLLPEVHRLEDDVELAVRSRDFDVLSSALLAYSRRVSTVVGHLKADDGLKDEKSVKLLVQAARAASNAKVALYSPGATDVFDITRTTIEKMRAASNEITELTVRLQKSTTMEGKS